MKSVRIACVFLLLFTATAFCADGNAVLGVWNNEEKDARIEIYHCADRYCGKIVWLKVPDWPADSKDGVPGTPKLDHHNPDPNLRTTPVMGLVMVNNFSFGKDGKYIDGTVYDPKNGKTYSGKMTLVSQDQLELRGFVGIPLFGRTTTWTRWMP
jgi:uncharacterized protein (DUF2147 family)